MTTMNIELCIRCNDQPVFVKRDGTHLKLCAICLFEIFGKLGVFDRQETDSNSVTRGKQKLPLDNGND